VRVVFSPRAANDIEEIGDYIFSDNPKAARKFITDLKSRCERLKNAPQGGMLRSELGHSTRSVPFGRYVIFYIALVDEIRIERVLHGARDIPAVYATEI
jgi:toxin ParE1/3/4